MENYLSKWMRIIEEMKNSNTYKTAWGRGIIECVYLKEYEISGESVVVNQSDIANKMIKYYWNQTFFFGLDQGHNPVILQRVYDMIDRYKEAVSTYPVPWDQIEPYFLKDKKFYNKIINAILSNAKTNVCPRFKVVKDGVLDIYDIDNKNKLLIFKNEDVLVLQKYAFVLNKLLNYKWAQLLERYNLAPKISSKVNAAGESKIKRQSLQKYKKALLQFYHNTEIRDFYTGEVLEKNNIHIDHVIPWSFVYSDEIWNLVVTSANNNLVKSNRPPTEEEISRLKKRNIALADKLKEDETSLNYKKALDYAQEHNIIDKLYINMKG